MEYVRAHQGTTKGSGLYLIADLAWPYGMNRSLLLQFAWALYHLTARGDRQKPIFEDDQDRLVFLDLLARDYKL